MTEQPYVAKTRKCRYCAKGHVPDAKGEHWMVKSIVPARIDIRKCANFISPHMVADRQNDTSNTDTTTNQTAGVDERLREIEGAETGR